MERPSVYSAFVELVLLFLAVVFTVVEKMIIPLGFMAVVIIGRYYAEVIDFVGNTVAMALDIAEVVIAPFSTEGTHSSSSSLTTTWSIIQLLLLVCLVVFLAILSARHTPQPTRQSLQDLLDETSRKFRVTEGTLRDWQSYGENQLRSNKELREQIKRLEAEKAQVIAEKVSKDKEIAESAEKIEHLTIDLDEAKSINRRLDNSRYIARHSLQVATARADRCEQAWKAAEDQISMLMARLDKPKKQDGSDNRVRQQATEIRALREDLAEKEKSHQARDQEIESMRTKFENSQARNRKQLDELKSFGSSLGQAQAAVEALEISMATQKAAAQLAAKDLDGARARILELERSLDTTKESLRQTRAESQESKDSLAEKDSSLQDAQATIMDLNDQVAELRLANQHQDLVQRIQLQTRQLSDSQAKGQRDEQALADKDASLRDSQEEVMNLKEQVEDLTAAKSQAANRAKVTKENHRREIEILSREIFTLTAGRNAQQAEQTDASANAMAVDDPVVEHLKTEVADHQERIKQLQTALDGAQTELRAAKANAGAMEAVDHRCDHTGCQQKESLQAAKFGKVHGDWMARGLRVATLEQQVQEQGLQIQNLRASTTTSPPVSNTASPDTLTPASRSEMSMQIAKLRTDSADHLVRARRELRKAIELEGKLREKSLECKELAAQLAREKVAASTRIEGAIREKIVGAKRALEEMKVERDRSRATNSTLLTRAEKAEKALAECQMQREHPGEEAEKLVGEATAVQADASAANPRKRGMDSEEGEEEWGASRAAKVSKPNPSESAEPAEG